MLRNKFLVILSVLAMLAGCKKESVRSGLSDNSPDECIQKAAFNNGEIVEGRYIILYKSNLASARGVTQQKLTSLSSGVLSKNNINKAALELSFSGEPGGFIASLSAEEASRLNKDENIAFVEPDRIISLGSCFTIAAPRLITWNVNRVGYGNGIGKRAWVIDTGIDFEHPDLTVDAGQSKSFVNGQSSAKDENGHGTHVAGIIGAKNNTIGVLGVASGATLVSLRVLDKEGNGLLSYIIQALAYVNTHASAGDVVNLSVGNDEGISNTLDQQVRYTAAKGIYIAIAAGNEKDLANKYSPARTNAANVYTVSAIDSLDNFAKFSNYGNDVIDFAAPGVRILSTYTNGRYAYLSGTSMAAPHVAGLLLLKGNNIANSGNVKNDPDGVADMIAHY
ncbi:MAG: S8 family serine peptidase [Chitinophagaceae bacterium]